MNQMQVLRTRIVARSGLDEGSKLSALSRLLNDTFKLHLTAEEEPLILNHVLLGVSNQGFSGASIKPTHFTLDLSNMIKGLPLLMMKASILDTLTIGIPVLYQVFESMKVKLEEKHCFILFSLHNGGQYKYSLDDASKLLKADWKVYPHYQMSDIDLSHAFTGLNGLGIIKKSSSHIQLIEKISIRYK